MSSDKKYIIDMMIKEGYAYQNNGMNVFWKNKFYIKLNCYNQQGVIHSVDYKDGDTDLTYTITNPTTDIIISLIVFGCIRCDILGLSISDTFCFSIDIGIVEMIVYDDGKEGDGVGVVDGGGNVGHKRYYLW
jgi:hypothetical protein